MGLEIGKWILRAGKMWKGEGVPDSWKEGSASARCGDRGPQLGAEWHLGKIGLALQMFLGDTIMGDGEKSSATFHVNVPGLNLFLSARNLFPEWMLPGSPDKYGDGREMGIRVFDGKVWVDIWSRSGEWRAKDPWWVRGFTIDPWEILFGGLHIDSEKEELGWTKVPLPEGIYEARVEKLTVIWSWPRWPWKKRWQKICFEEFKSPVQRERRMVEFDLESVSSVRGAPDGVAVKGTGVTKVYGPFAEGKAIPYPGKGSASYNCGMDGRFASSLPGSDLLEAVGSLVADILQTREKRTGDPFWIPELEEVED